MIKFDTNHSYTDTNLDEKTGKKIGKKILASAIIIANLFTFSACSKTNDCEIDIPHAHYYTDEHGFGRFIMSEKESIDCLQRTDNYMIVNEEDVEKLKFVNKHGLFKIDENYEAIAKVEDYCQDYTEYKNEKAGFKYILMPSGFKLFPTMKDSWDESPNNNYTGEERNCHYKFYAYKVVDNGNGNYKLERSDFVDSFSDLNPEYEYVSKNFTVISNDYDNNMNYTDSDISYTL